MAKINEIDITSLTLQEGAAPSTPASTKWKIYAKTDGLYQIDDAGSETSLAGGGGGGASVTRVGRTTAGASWLGPSTNRVARKVSLTSGDVVMSVGMYLRTTLENVAGFLSVALFDDDSTGTSQPGHLLGITNSTPTSDEFVFDQNDERWFYVPLNVYVPSTGSYWIAFYMQDFADIQIAYDATGGTAATMTASGAWWSEFGAVGHSFTAQVYDLSMHAVVLG